MVARLTQRWAQTLTRHFQQTKARDATDLYTSTILTHRITHAVFYFTLVTHWRHVDEVDNNQAAQVTQTQLACDFIRCFQVGVQRGFFDIATARCTGGVDIDSGQGFGRIDNDRATRRQTHFTLEG